MLTKTTSSLPPTQQKKKKLPWHLLPCKASVFLLLSIHLAYIHRHAEGQTTKIKFKKSFPCLLNSYYYLFFFFKHPVFCIHKVFSQDYWDISAGQEKGAAICLLDEQVLKQPTCMTIMGQTPIFSYQSKFLFLERLESCWAQDLKCISEITMWFPQTCPF